MSNGFFKFLEGWILNRNECARAFRFLVFRLYTLFQSIQLRGRRPIFRARIFVIELANLQRIRTANFDRLNREDGRATNDADLLAFGCGVQPFAEVLFRLGNGQSFHKVFLAPL